MHMSHNPVNSTFTEVCVEFKTSLTGFVTNWCNVGKGDMRLIISTAPKKMKTEIQFIHSLLILFSTVKGKDMCTSQGMLGLKIYSTCG